MRQHDRLEAQDDPFDIDIGEDEDDEDVDEDDDEGEDEEEDGWQVGRISRGRLTLYG